MNKKATKWDLRFLYLAEHIASWSKDPSTQCGAVITTPMRTIVSTGYNGFPQYMDDNPLLYEEREVKYDRIIHAEMNAVLNSNGPVDGCTLYVWPLLCCSRCAIHMIQSGIERCVSPRLPGKLDERWGQELEKSRSYFQEANIGYIEIDTHTSTIFRQFTPTEESLKLGQE